MTIDLSKRWPLTVETRTRSDLFASSRTVGQSSDNPMQMTGDDEVKMRSLFSKSFLPVNAVLGVAVLLGGIVTPAGADNGVDFPVSCSAPAAALVEQGVEQLHHMMYLNARSKFSEAESIDETCGMALWGVAMTYIHPLWPDRPTRDELLLGAELAETAARLDGMTPREQAYLATAAAYFRDGLNRTEPERLRSFESAWEIVTSENPEDLEARAFHALSQLATVDRGDATYSQQRAAGELLEQVLVQVPDHPGGHHYLIHAYDFPGLAEKALPTARNYGVVAPAVPHALHMMSHIFTLEGLWGESIEWNKKSADAALQLSLEIGAVSVHYLHALDYLVYAHLQTGNETAARDVVETMANLEPPFDAVNRDAQAYALAASPVRLALERKDWSAATELQPRSPQTFPWEARHDKFVAMTHFARGLGFAQLGDADKAGEELQRLVEIRDATAVDNAYWARQVDIQRLALDGLIAFVTGEHADGSALLAEASMLEAGTQKSPVTPGAVLPAAELHGEMLLAMGEHEAALAAFEQSLRHAPLRANGLFGAAEALRAMGNAVAAQTYYEQIANQSMGHESAIIRAAREQLR